MAENTAEVKTDTLEYKLAVLLSVLTLPSLFGFFAFILIYLGVLSEGKGERETAKLHIKVAYVMEALGFLGYIGFLVVLFVQN